MDNRDKMKQERSMPVQGRVDIVALANIAAYAFSSGAHIRTMSGLLSYGIEIARVALEKAGMLEKVYVEVGESFHFLTMTGLYKGHMLDVAKKKLNAVIGFENLRKEGVDPEFYAPNQYNMLHNNNSVEIVNPLCSRTKAEEMVAAYERFERKKMIEDDDARSNEIIANLEYNEDGSVKTLPAYEFRQTPAITAEPTKLGRPPKNPTTSPPVEKPVVRILAPNEMRDKLNAMTHEERRAYVESLKPKKKVKDSDIPRAMTEDELAAAAERLKQKDKDLMDALDYIPPTRTSECALPQTNE